MNLVLDTHAHVYPSYDLQVLFSRALSNLDDLAGALFGTEHDATRGLLLAERNDCSFYDDLRAGEVALPAGWEVASSGEHALELASPNGPSLHLMPGRQVVTRERLEVLALLTAVRPDDGVPLDATVSGIREGGGVPVIPWSIGKWWGERGRVLNAFLAAPREGPLYLGDSLIRAAGWPAPGPFRLAPVLAGTDPLPLPGEEALAGSYGIGGAVESENVTEAVRELLTAASPAYRIGGRRLSALRVARRWLGLRRIPEVRHAS